MRRVAIQDPESLTFRKREITDQVLIDDSGLADFIQDDTSTAMLGPPWPSAEPPADTGTIWIPVNTEGFLLDDNGDKVA